MRSAVLLEQYWSKSVLIGEVNRNNFVKCSSEIICIVISYCSNNTADLISFY